MNTVILLEGKTDLNQIKKEVFDKDSIIVSFDYEAHLLLNQSKINHKFVEEYFDEVDKLKIDNLSLELTTTWYKNKNISKYLEWGELNLGSLLELEITQYFFMNLKRIIAIKKIIEQEKPEKIISYSLKNYVDKICKNIKIENIGKYKKENSSGLFYDKIEMPINVGFKTIKIKISRKKYFVLKKILDNVVNYIFKIKPNIELLTKNESILLLDFDTIIYEDLFKSFQTSPKNIIILNQRKPPIWNLKSYKIIKKSKSKILSIDYFKNKDLEAKIFSENNILKNRLDHLWEKEEYFKTIFMINEESFWEIIKKDFIEIVTERSMESVKRLILLNELFDKINVHSILDWAHLGMEEKLVSHIANKKKIPIFCLQHGVMTLNSSMTKYLPIMPVLPSNNTKMLVWGKSMENYILQHDIKKEDVRITGSPRHDRFFNQKNKVKNDGYVLIASNSFFHINFNGTDSRAFRNLEISLRKILLILKSTPNKKPIIKLHPAEYFHIKHLIKKIDSTIPIYQHEDILPLLQSCDSMISLNYSTVLLDALILNKPTMVILTEKQNFEEEELIKNKATLCVSDLNNLENDLNKLLFDDEIRTNLINNGNQFVDNYLSNHGTASKYLVKILSNH